MVNHNENLKVFLNTLGNDPYTQKVLFESVASWVSRGKKLNIDLVGTNDQIKIIKDVMIETKKFQDELFHDQTNLNDVFDKLSMKHVAAEAFEKTFGISWVL